MGSTLFAVALPLALGIVMFGLGLTLTVADFVRVARYPKLTLLALQVFAVVLVPVAAGMAVRWRFPEWSGRRQSTVKIAAAVVLVVAAALVSEFDTVTGHIGELGVLALLLCVCSLLVGYLMPRAFGMVREDAIAAGMEIGVHNAALAITVATTVLDNETMAVPAGLYGFLMNIPAALAAFLFARTRHDEPAPAPAA